MMCLKYMSEDEVADMARANDLFPEEDEEWVLLLKLDYLQWLMVS
jgi:hypothetical protein